jgi:hypothetical protein
MGVHGAYYEGAETYFSKAYLFFDLAVLVPSRQFPPSGSVEISQFV